MGELEERLNEGPEVGLLPQDSNVASLVSSVEQMEQMDTGNAAPADAIIDLDEQSESTPFEWAKKLESEGKLKVTNLPMPVSP
ncbi:hypothetical protein FIBSPDRAFT_970853 [Athelia psychrophila]|uniref:Uncharacterized protein n=1 Tax=Athelia psychrophila TaxID=1759441 RepID=A0A167SH32_9AGAM|nr:hypothetical protein FIBSPDRAFT_970853 [Fibularhizoctonia sp. CBS 109695]